MLDAVVVGGQVVCEGTALAATIGIQGERIAAIVDPSVALAAARTIDARGTLVLPGVVEPHLHYDTGATYFANIPGAQVDDVESASRSAAYGGVTTMLPFWWPPKGERLAAFLPRTIDDGRRRSYVDFAPHCCLWPDLDHIAEIPQAITLGITSFKATMGYRHSGRMSDGYYLAKQMAAIRDGGLMMVHAEDGNLIEHLEEQLIAAGKVGPESYLPSRPNVSEQAAIEQAVTAARILGCPLYVVHLSTREGLALITAAHARGERVFTETCPHYLLLTDAETRRQPVQVKIAPPLRSEADCAALWEGLRQGVIECVGSDHAPFALADKERGFAEGNIFKVTFGMPGVETMLPLMYSEGVRKGRVSLPRLAEVMSEGPARRFGLYPKKGAIKIGSDADLVIFDPSAEWTIRGEALHSNARWSAYEGWRVVGKPVQTLLRGQLLLDGERLAAGPGHGQYIARRPFAD